MLLLGAEELGNVRALMGATGAGFPAPDWNEPAGFPLKARGPGLDASPIGPEDMRHRVMQPMQFYVLMEKARRAPAGLARSTYRERMGKFFAPFSRVAARNP